jgi:hypothetical protein
MSKWFGVRARTPPPARTLTQSVSVSQSKAGSDNVEADLKDVATRLKEWKVVHRGSLEKRGDVSSLAD